MTKPKNGRAAARRKADARLLRAASVRSQSFDADANTVDIVWTTGASVSRSTWDGDFEEVLSLEPGAVRLDRLNAGAPFLNTHSSWTLSDVIGSVVPGSARIDGGKGLATILLSGAAADADTVGKIRDGVIRNISVGYLIHRFEDAEQDGVTTRNVIDWEPLEISAVPIPADPGSQIRSHDRRRAPARRNRPARPAPKPKVSARVADIRTWARTAGVPKLGEKHIRLGTSSDDFFRLLVDRLTGRGNTTEDSMTKTKDQAEFERDFQRGRRAWEKATGRKAPRDTDDDTGATIKDKDETDDDEDRDEMCPTCGRPMPDAASDDDDDDDDKRDDDDDSDSQRSWGTAARSLGMNKRVRLEPSGLARGVAVAKKFFK